MKITSMIARFMLVVLLLKLIIVESLPIPSKNNEEDTSTFRYVTEDAITEADDFDEDEKVMEKDGDEYYEDDEDDDDDDDDLSDEVTYDDPFRGRRKRVDPSIAENLWKINLNRTKASKNFFQSDIHLDLIQNLKMKVKENFAQDVPERTRTKRAARSKEPDYLWKHNTIYYKIDGSVFTKDTKGEIRRGIKHWKKSMKYCLKFVRLRNKSMENNVSKKRFGGGPVEHILFTSTDSGCWSQVGRTDTRIDRRKYVPGQQLISIGEGCGEKGTVIHEIGHAVGFWHEQSRRDRDDYVRIVRNNIITGQKTQFKRMALGQVDSMGYAYDFWSIMHYGQYFFSKNDRPTIRIVKKYRSLNPTLGQRNTLSYLDIAQVRSMYKCNILPSPQSKKDCVSKKTKGRDYRGKLDYTKAGVMCQPWNKKYPHTHNYDLTNEDDNLQRNYCRNPGGEKERPWCYTTLANKNGNQVWDYCDVEVCDS